MNDPNSALLLLDEKTGRPPQDSRVGTAMAIRARCEEMRQNDFKRARNRATMQGWFDGTTKPYSSAKLVSTAQGDRTNFNPREAGGMSEAARSPFYSLIFRNPQFASIQIDYGRQKQLRDYWGKGISKAYHKMLRNWEEHDYNVQFYQRELVDFGVGCTMWMDDENWQWEPFTIGELGVPDRSASLVTKLPEACRRRTILPVDLWNNIKDEKSARAMGWFPERVKKAIAKAAPVTLRTANNGEWSEEYQSQLNRGDISWSGSAAEILLEDYFCREFDGKITHCILVMDAGMQEKDGLEDEGLLFKMVGRYESFCEVLCLFFYDIGSKGQFHQVKGMGPKIFDNSTASARLLCDTIDGAKRAASVVLEATDATSLQQAQLPTINGATLIQPGWKATQVRIGENLEGCLTVKRELADILQNNGGPYRQRAGMENQEPTLGQAQLNYRSSEGLSESANDRFCKTLDRQHKETFRRALVAGVKLYKARNPETDYEQPEEYGKLPMWKELAYYFVRECIEDYQVPIEALDMKFICSVTATRGMGSGSPVGMDMATQNLLQLYPMLDERGKRNALAKRVAFVAGPENLHEFVTEYEAADVPTDHKWAATMENNGMRDPMADLLVTPLQDHVAHIERHFQFALKLLQGLQAGQIDPMQALMVLHVLGPHGKDHMNQLAGDPGRKAQLQAIEADWLQLSKIVDQLQQQVQEAQANQQPPKPQMDPEMVKVLGDLQLKRVKEQGNLQIKAETARAKSAIADSQAAHAMRLETLKALPTADIHPLGAAA